MIGVITKKSKPSAYTPSEEIRELTSLVKKDFNEGIRIIEEPVAELNDRSVVTDTNRGQMMFNAYVDTTENDPNEAWKWRGTRSMARNKGISMHAQLTASYLMPSFQAQNEADEIDRDFSEVMGDVVEWMAQPTNSDYQSSFLQVSFGMMYNPITYMGAEFHEIYQDIKEVTENGKYMTKEVLDEVLSGFKAPIWSPTEILLTNAYERNIQKQRAIIKRRYVEYEEMEAKYKDHENWVHVQKGIKSVYNDADELFYDIRDDEHVNLVAEEIWTHRRNDSEVPFLNGIYMGDKNVKNNRVKHRDHRDAPKYNIIPFGYMRIGTHYAYYKSMMNALGWDNMAYDAMSEIVFNRAILENEMPIAISGTDKVDSSVIFPNSVVSFEDKDTRISPLLPPSNTALGFQELRETEKSMSESSVSESIQGQLPAASQTAFSVSQAQSNAKKNIGAIGKSLGESMVMYGDLMKDIVLNNITAPQIEELVGGQTKLKYKSFLLENKKTGGKMGDKLIRFDADLIGKEMTDTQKMNEKMKLVEESGYPHKTKSIRRINPEQFAKFHYLTKIDIEEMFTKTNEYWQPILLGLKQALANDPFVDQESLTRKLLYSYFKSEGEELMKEESQQMPGMPEGINMEGKGSAMGQQALNQATAGAMNQPQPM